MNKTSNKSDEKYTCLLTEFNLHNQEITMVYKKTHTISFNEGIQSEIEVDDRLWTSNASFVARLFQNSDVSAKEYANL